jgi:uncharacterized membrane protein YvbJ
VGACGTHLDLPRTLRETREKKKKKKKIKAAAAVAISIIILIFFVSPFGKVLPIPRR